MSLAKSRSADSGSSTIVQDGDEIGQIMFKGADGNDVDSTGAAIIGLVDGSPGSNDMPGALTFLTTNDGNNSPSERLRVTSGGLIGINTIPGTLLELRGESSKEADVTFNRQPVQGTNDGVIGQLLFENNTDSVAQISVKRESAADDAYIQFATQATGGGMTEKLRIDSSGRVGILTSVPGDLNVNGDDLVVGNGAGNRGI